MAKNTPKKAAIILSEKKEIWKSKITRKNKHKYISRIKNRIKSPGFNSWHHLFSVEPLQQNNLKIEGSNLNPKPSPVPPEIISGSLRVFFLAMIY